ncbi:TSA 417 [Symbiodinium natans]|uniref:TSA 417 protein n=1 Tax=Symbiodinium natans TaxID=878477 RepID=A0A812RH03_9DINO|nr:TSA 417 [Symbiodinium natans]
MSTCAASSEPRYLICAVLRALGLWEKEEDEEGPPILEAHAQIEARDPHAARAVLVPSPNLVALVQVQAQAAPARFARLADGTRVDIATVRSRGVSPRNDATRADARRGMRVNDDWKIPVADESVPQEILQMCRVATLQAHVRPLRTTDTGMLADALLQKLRRRLESNRGARTGLTRKGLPMSPQLGAVDESYPDKANEITKSTTQHRQEHGKTGTLIDMWEDIAELGGKHVDVMQPVRSNDSTDAVAFQGQLVHGLRLVEGGLCAAAKKGESGVEVGQAGRGYLDQEDYVTTQVSTAATVALLLPEAEVALRKYLAAGEKNLKFRMQYLARVRRVHRIISASIAICLLVLVSPITMGDAVTWAAPSFFVLLFILVTLQQFAALRFYFANQGKTARRLLDVCDCSICLGCDGPGSIHVQVGVHAVMDRLLIPWLSPMKITMLSVLRETPDEIAVMEKVLEAYRSFPQEEEESSEDGDESSDYSSANESFLDEDPASKNLPEVLGSKKVKILVRPKAARLRMRYELMRSLPASGDHLLRYQREEPLKYGRLLRVPGLLPPLARRGPRSRKQDKVFMRKSTQACFSPTMESDWCHKESLFRLRRSHSLGTGVAFENKPEEREPRDHWNLHTDIFDEHSRSGIPQMPKVYERMPERGLVDQFEMVGTFKPAQTRSIKEVALNGLITDTRLGDRLWRTFAARFSAVTGMETRCRAWCRLPQQRATAATNREEPRPQDAWQQPVDEALQTPSHKAFLLINLTHACNICGCRIPDRL